MIVLRAIKLLFLLLVAIGLVLLLFANNAPVGLRLMPDELATIVGIRNDYSVSLFLIVVGALLVGIVVGFVLEWLREHPFRVEAKKHQREAKRLNREVSELKDGSVGSDDDVLSILDNADKARG